MSVRIDEVSAPCKVCSLNICGIDTQFKTIRLHRSHITILHTTHLGIDNTNQVVVITLIPVKFHIDAIAQEAQLNTNIQLMLLLKRQVAIGTVGLLQAALT